MQSFTVASRHCSFIATVQQADKQRREEEEKRLEGVSVVTGGPGVLGIHPSPSLPLVKPGKVYEATIRVRKHTKLCRPHPLRHARGAA
jgi:hypothetical protein